jgi:hypothetical protein
MQECKSLNIAPRRREWRRAAARSNGAYRDNAQVGPKHTNFCQFDDARDRYLATGRHVANRESNADHVVASGRSKSQEHPMSNVDDPAVIAEIDAHRSADHPRQAKEPLRILGRGVARLIMSGLLAAFGGISAQGADTVK